VSTFSDVTCLIDRLLGGPGCLGDCPNLGGGEGGGGQSGMPGGGEGASAAQAPTPSPSEQEGESVSAPDEPEDPAFVAHWNTFVEWFDANQPQAHPDRNEAQWDAWGTDVMTNILYFDTVRINLLPGGLPTSTTAISAYPSISRNGR